MTEAAGVNESATPRLALHHFPGACSQVALFALEACGLDYELRLVDIAREEQSGASYVAISPLGKVPALLADGVSLTENAAIVTYIAALRPEAKLFPTADSPLAAARRQQGLSFCGGTLHPIVRGIANPSRLTDGDGAPVRSRATSLAIKAFGYAEQRLSEAEWWLGDFSLIDVYINWAVSVARRGGFPLDALPGLSALHARLLERPAYARTMEIEAESARRLEVKRAGAAAAETGS